MTIICYQRRNVVFRCAGVWAPGRAQRVNGARHVSSALAADAAGVIHPPEPCCATHTGGSPAGQCSPWQANPAPHAHGRKYQVWGLAWLPPSTLAYCPGSVSNKEQAVRPGWALGPKTPGSRLRRTWGWGPSGCTWVGPGSLWKPPPTWGHLACARSKLCTRSHGSTACYVPVCHRRKELEESLKKLVVTWKKNSPYRSQKI